MQRVFQSTQPIIQRKQTCKSFRCSKLLFGLGMLLVSNIDAFSTKLLSINHSNRNRCSRFKRTSRKFVRFDESEDSFNHQKLSRKDLKKIKFLYVEEKRTFESVIKEFRGSVRDLLRNKQYTDLQLLKSAIKNPENYPITGDFNKLAYWFFLYPNEFEQAYIREEQIEVCRSKYSLKLTVNYIKQQYLRMRCSEDRLLNHFSFRLLDANLNKSKDCGWLEKLTSELSYDIQLDIFNAYNQWFFLRSSCLELPEQESIQAWVSQRLPSLNDTSDVSFMLKDSASYYTFVMSLSFDEMATFMQFVEKHNIDIN